MKKLVVYLCVGVMVLGFTACGGNKDNTQSTEQVQTVESQPISGTQEGGAGQATDTPVEGTQAAEGNTTGEYMDISNGWSEEMNALKTAVVDALGENYWPNAAIDPEMLEGMFGLTPDMYSDYLAEMPMISTNVDTLLIIKSNDDKVEAVVEALTAYRDNLVADTMQYPMNLGKIQASRIERIGNYVCFVQLGGEYVAGQNMTEEESIIKCQEQNELAIEIISQNLEH